MATESLRSQRRAYVEWVEAQIENYKETIPRSQLLSIADEVVAELRVTRGGQYQLTEMLMWGAMDRRLFRMLKLPGYRAWCELRRRAEASLIPDSLTPPEPPPARVPALALAPARAPAVSFEHVAVATI
ncbi:MAG TPA: hypothetical protein VFX98_02900 [Longimicrobiaceae bacterium]|nr:hypothetical protein [Longimicrobiaceae bacterium]